MNEEELHKFLHDIRNPVAAIQISAEVALQDPSLSQSARETLTSILSEAQKLAEMLRNPTE